MLFRSWFRTLKSVVRASRKGRRRQPERKVRAKNRLSVEALEDRFLLSTFNTLADSLLDRPIPDSNQETVSVQSAVLQAIISEPTLALLNAGGNLDFIQSLNKPYAIQSDGKIVVLDKSWNGFTLWRYNPDGRLDAGFGQWGLVDVGVLGQVLGEATSLAVQADGTIVVTGIPWGADSYTPLVRFHGDGRLDSIFAWNNYLTRQSDGKIIVLDALVYGFSIWRYNADGTLDTNFGQGGKVGGTPLERALGFVAGLTVQGDGKIVVMGHFGPASDLPLVRYHTDGDLDSVLAWNKRMALQDNGKIVVLDNYENIIALWQYNADGSLDTSFGREGMIFVFSGWYNRGTAFSFQRDGKMVVLLSSTNWGGSNNFGGVTTILRYNSDGSLDTTFGDDGWTIWSSGGLAEAVGIQNEGKIVVFRLTKNGFVLTRLNPNGFIDIGFGHSGSVSVLASRHFSWFRMGILGDGNIVVTHEGFKDLGSPVVDFIGRWVFNSDGRLVEDCSKENPPVELGSSKPLTGPIATSLPADLAIALGLSGEIDPTLEPKPEVPFPFPVAEDPVTDNLPGMTADQPNWETGSPFPPSFQIADERIDQPGVPDAFWDFLTSQTQFHDPLSLPQWTP